MPDRLSNCYQVAVKVLRAVKMKRADSVSLRMLKILTGRVPFYNYTNDVWITVAITQGVRPARKEYLELPEDNKFWDVLEACWRTDPAARPSMADLASAICEL
ncbi:hypothetical protein FRB96_006664 [Tulasnella sp. 330]|nr:hypothetical protein FRB96_006664 [Tulasnella sp. 330]